MKFLVVLIIVAVARTGAAPAKSVSDVPEAVDAAASAESTRNKRSSYGGGYAQAAPVGLGSSGYGGYGAAQAIPSYAAIPQLPCSSAPIAFAQAPAYQQSHASLSAYAPHAAQAYGGGYGGPHYRATENDDEMMSYSDMDEAEHVALARSYGYDAAPALSLGGGYGGALSGLGASYGPAVGVFPSGNVRSCSVPLLLSCSPSVSAGRLVSSPHYGASAHYGAASHYGGAVVAASAPAAVSLPAAYRGVDDHGLMKEDHEDAHHEEPMAAREQSHLTSSENQMPSSSHHRHH